jgi:hypothetical protein
MLINIIASPFAVKMFFLRCQGRSRSVFRLVDRKKGTSSHPNRLAPAFAAAASKTPERGLPPPGLVKARVRTERYVENLEAMSKTWIRFQASPEDGISY